MNIKSWAFENKIELNWDKINENVLRRPYFNDELLPDPVSAIEHVLEARLSGILISSKFSFNSHVNNLPTISSQRMFLLMLLRQQGSPPLELDFVYPAISVIRYSMCALPRPGL